MEEKEIFLAEGILPSQAALPTPAPEAANEANIPDAETKDAEKAQFSGWKSKSAQFITSQTVSLFGSAIVRYAIMWHIVLSTHSGIMTTLITLCVFLPQMLISLFAGVWADKYSRKMLIMTSDLFIAASSLMLALYFLFGGTHIWMMFVVTALSSLGTGVQTPAVNAFIPQIVPKEKLGKVNSIISSTQSITFLLAPALSGVLLANVDMFWIFGIDVVTACTAVLIVLFLKVAPHKSTASDNHPFTDLKEGMKYVVSHKFLLQLLTFMTLLMFCVTPVAMLTTLQVTRLYGDDYFYLTGVEVAFSAGMILGGVVMGVTGGFKNRGHTISLVTIVTAVFGAFLGVIGILGLNFYVYAAILFILGLFIPALNISAMTLAQENVEPDKMGRVFGIYSIVNSAIMPLAMLFLGPLADVISIEWILIVANICQAVLLIFALKGSWNKLKH